jgi:D-alanine-D-alanine ligase
MPIAAGEQITMEYATFCGPNMTLFDCTCGSAACRGRVSGSDHLAPWLEQLYGEHVSMYVAAARHKAAVLAAPARSCSANSDANMQVV